MKRRGRVTPAKSGPHPDFADACASYAKGDLQTTKMILDKLHVREGRNPAFHNLRGIMLGQAKDFEGAQQAFLTALRLDPRSADTLANLGWISGLRQDLPGALTYYEQVLEVAPKHVNALMNKALTLHLMGRSEEGILVSKTLLELDPGNVQGMFNLATMYQNLRDFQTVHRLYDEVLKRDPGHERALGNFIFTQHYLAREQPHEVFELANSLAARLEQKNVERRQRHWINTPDPERKLRIGLVSADLRDHPVGFFLEGLLSQTVDVDVQWIVFHNSDLETALTGRLRSHVHEWHVVAGWSDSQVIEAIRNTGVDVLMDLSGYTGGHRLPVFATKPAPLQITWLGYFATTGLSTMDCVIADPFCVPEGEEYLFTEQVLRMPQIRYCYTAPMDAPPIAGLPAISRNHVTFGSFQELAKINDQVLASWAAIARALPEARWRLQSGRLSKADVAQELLQRMCGHGFDPLRIELSGSVPKEDYLRSYGEVDFILDTFPYPGGTTTAEALWMGVPTLTLVKPGMLGRQGEAINRSVGLPDWVANTEEEYVEKALYWTSPDNWPVLSKLRAGLREHVAKQPLFDQKRFARDWHALIRQAWRDACARGWPQAPT